MELARDPDDHDRGGWLMSTVSGDAAIAWMRAQGTNVPGSCLNTCWQAYGSHPSIGDHAGQYPDAIDGWNYATKHHPGDIYPPAGYPVWFGPSPTRTDSNAGAGDVVISIGGGQIIGTDANGIGGRIGIMTIPARAAQIQRPYLGWTEDFLGYDVVTTSTASIGATPLQEDFLSALTDAEQREILNAVRNDYAADFQGGPSMKDDGKSISQSLGEIHAILSREIDRAGVKNSQIQELADVKTLALNLQAQVGALTKVVSSVAVGQGVDPASIQAAAKAGAEEALANLTLKPVAG